MTDETLPEYINALLQPEIYPHGAANVELIQTHISFVTLAGDYVYKWKKPVDFGFLDFSTIEKRELYCNRELKLNRRLCPDVYLDVITINRKGDGYELNGEGEVVEFGIKMCRMDESGMMSRKIEKGQVTAGDLDRIVDALVPFYESAAGDSEIQQYGKVDAVGVNVIENFDQTEGFIDENVLPRDLFEQVKHYAVEFMKQEEVFQKRIDDSKIRDCHGDLYSANICFDKENTYIFDCIEFNERFRYGDVCADIGFLAMDLDFHDLDSLSEHLVKSYVQKSGDEGIWQVLDFYKCYRAYVRAKIGLFTANDPAVDEETSLKILQDTKKYFQLAKRYAGAV